MSYIILDCETTGLDWHKDQIHGVAVKFPGSPATYITQDSALWRPFLLKLQNPTIAKVGHNLRFDLRFLSRFAKVEGQLYDTMLIAQLVDENNSVGLKQLSERYLGKAAVSGKAELDRTMAHAGARHVGELCRLDLEAGDEAPYFDIIAQYALEDAENTYELFTLLSGKLKQIDQNWRAAKGVAKTPLNYLKEEAAAVEPALLAMELRGILLNPAACESTQWEVSQALSKVETDIHDLCHDEIEQIEESLYVKEVGKRKSEKGKAKVERRSEAYGTQFLLSSNNHVGSLIYDKLASNSSYRTKSGIYSTSDENLSSLQRNSIEGSKLSKFLSLFSNYRSLQKLWTTYVGPKSGLLEHTSASGRVHSLYLQAGSSKSGGKGGTATGRLSSQSPNMQNLPRSGDVKKFFVPDPGHVFIYADYSQVELRIAAHLSKDEELINAYRDKLDLHSITASAVFGRHNVTKEQRQIGKTLNFAMIYDASPFRLHQELGPLGYSLEACEDMRDAFFAKYSGYNNYLKTELVYLKRDKLVISETGRVRRLPDISFGECLEWRGRIFVGNADQLAALKVSPTEQLGNSEAFERARKKYRHAIKQAYNFPIQSLGASITKRALTVLHSKGYDLVTSVHDSIVVQVPIASAKLEALYVQQILEENYTLSVPLVAETKILQSLDESDNLKEIEEERRDEDNRHSGRSEDVLARNAS